MPYERLANVASELTEEIHELRESVNEVDTKRKRSAAAIWGVILAIVLAIGLNIYVGYQNQHLSQQNNKLLHIVKDATDPTGQIYHRNLENQADAIKQLVCDNHKLHGDPHPAGLNCP